VQFLRHCAKNVQTGQTEKEQRKSDSSCGDGRAEIVIRSARHVCTVVAWYVQIAVDNENVEIVELLLRQEGVHIGDALLYAIREGVYRIVELLIDHPSISRQMLGVEWAAQKRAESPDESSDYSPDVSPVMLAAHCNQFEILQLLLSRGARIVRPHALTCCCARCRHENSEDSLRHSLLRIHTYRALSSPAWISLTSADPVLTAFRLSWELDHLAMRENEFKVSIAFRSCV